jgi:hypothetical protein
MAAQKPAQKPPPVLYVDVDLTDNVPLPPPEDYHLLEGRSLLVYSSPDGRVLLIPRAPLRHPSAWGVL